MKGRGQLHSFLVNSAPLADSHACPRALTAAIGHHRHAVAALRPSAGPLVQSSFSFLSRSRFHSSSSCSSKTTPRWLSVQPVNPRISSGTTGAAFLSFPPSGSSHVSSRIASLLSSSFSPLAAPSRSLVVSLPPSLAKIASLSAETQSSARAVASFPRRRFWFSARDTQEKQTNREQNATDSQREGAADGAGRAQEKDEMSADGAKEPRTQGAPVVTFTSADGQTKLRCAYRPGQTVLMVAFENDVGIEGACGGQCACSTCHVILSKADFAKFPEADDDEQDMLDLAVHTTDTSRLGCRLKLDEDHNGLELQLPVATVNQMYR
ncbi:putative 2Fe-2S iron-sulfur cluster binding domain containing protein [Neospora caninum Liverpool]|uniref:2Fe-2S iron-sulfur cluster binding domain containing protein, putative n=1 Tax=Neospora caninum (strain Liverpool) TaxID=572307 RepID=F0VKK4_NEOCL|nr:putative 2Fe-2S iron-sulfur cluster binding domain containing protein [Neospora caninum Liverpool]CBZ54605.1 putative 2Fe-2S iron-sulfur cluster binding domain containing protein [Neospora caninum Liverpool]CEL69319.1 TPA: 2Fe-2S iron-sulfur cluster binding domain containing protein, putative [Neospora caninum Liverpool]|eukprot:XP_003884635.1 putative 2Fe-2S iron-sulfur cluster binding domain containing protein [Neospora caninum Liverpool]